MKIGQNDLCPCGSGIRFEDYCANKLKVYRGVGLGGVMEEVRELLEGRSFASVEDADALLSKYVQQRNQAPKDDFDALSPEQILRSCYSLRCLESFAAFLGLAEIQRDSARRCDRDFRLRKLPLLDHVVQFHL